MLLEDLTIPNGSYAIKTLRKKNNIHLLTLENDLLLLAYANNRDVEGDALVNNETVHIKIYVDNNQVSCPLTIVVAGLTISCDSYKVLLTKGDIMEELV